MGFNIRTDYSCVCSHCIKQEKTSFPDCTVSFGVYFYAGENHHDTGPILGNDPLHF